MIELNVNLKRRSHKVIYSVKMDIQMKLLEIFKKLFESTWSEKYQIDDRGKIYNLDNEEEHSGFLIRNSKLIGINKSLNSLDLTMNDVINILSTAMRKGWIKTKFSQNHINTEYDKNKVSDKALKIWVDKVLKNKNAKIFIDTRNDNDKKYDFKDKDSQYNQTF